MTCADSEELLALAALGVLSLTEAQPLDTHLRVCATCRETAAACVRTVSAMPGGLPNPAPPASLRRKLLRAAYADAVTPARHPPRRLELHSDVPSPPRLRSLLGRPRVLAIAAGTVTVAAAVATLLAIARPDRHHPPLPSRTYTVVGSTSDPGVHGTLTEDGAAREAVITVTGLPQPGSVGAGVPGVYELWVIRGGGSAEGVAFLAQSPVDHAWRGVISADLSHFVAVGATPEPAGGSPQPTGAQVFSVQLTR